MSEEFEVQRTTFGMVPEWVDELVTDGSAMRVYVRLARKYANAKTRECYPTQEALAEELGMGVKAVKRAIGILKSQGALYVRRSRRDDGKLGRNRYWLPMDQVGTKYREWLAPEANISAGRDQGSQESHGDQGSQTSPGPGVANEPSGNQTHEQTRRETAAAAASEAVLELPEVEDELAKRRVDRRELESPPVAPTLNQRANLLAGLHYERLGKMGNVPAFLKIIKKALEHGYTDEQVDRACAWLADRRWTLTEEKLANTLRGGPQRAGTPPTTTDGPVLRTGRMILET